MKVNITGNDFDLVDVTISDGNDIHCVNILDFGGAEIDGKDLTDVVAKFNDVTNVIVIVGNDFEAAKNILHGILESKTNDDRSDADTGEHRRDIDTKELHDNQDGDDDNGCYNDAP